MITSGEGVSAEGWPGTQRARDRLQAVACPARRIVRVPRCGARCMTPVDWRNAEKGWEVRGGREVLERPRSNV